MTGWTKLKRGDLVDLIAPGYAVDSEKIDSGVKILESWGLRVRWPKDLVKPFYFHAQTDEKRAEITRKALFAKDSAAVWCVRGGYGSIRLVPELLKVRKPASPKLFVGISDISTLHLLLNQKWKWPTLHGPLLDRLGSGTLPDDYVEELRALIFGEEKQVHFRDLQPMNLAADRAKKLEGSVVGGNLTVLQSALATKIHPRTKGKILFLEDLGERGYRVDRMLEQFKQAGLFQGCLGVVFGPFLGGQEPGSDEKKTFVPYALERFANDIKIPVWQGIEVGHGDEQRALPFGTKAVLQRSTLTVRSGAR